MGVGEKKLFASRVGQSNPGVKNIAIGAFVGAAAVYGLGLLTSNNVATYPSMLMRAVPDAHDNIAAAAAIGCPTVGHVTIVVNDNIEDGQYNFLARDFESAKGEKWSLFKPMVEHADFLKGVPVLMAHPESWIKAIETKLQYLDQVTTGWKDGPIGERAREAYLQGKISLLFFSDVTKYSVQGLCNGAANALSTFDDEKRKLGHDWTYLGETMTGLKRLNNVHDLLIDIFKREIPGDYIETGVWRGGASILARAIMRVHGQGDRMSYVCDSFRGLPPGDRKLDAADNTWKYCPYLEVADKTVASSFRHFGLLDPSVVFAKGFFNETMPQLSTRTKQFAIMRLDGDMYESTVDVLYNLYDKLSIGGYLIMDDWNGFPSKTAVLDFFDVHGISPEIKSIDNLSIYWKKTEEVDIQYWRYTENKFTKADQKSI